MCIKYKIGDIKKVIKKYKDDDYVCFDCDVDENDEIDTAVCYGDSRYDE